MFPNEEDRVLDAEQWRVEAQAVINDVRDHVRDMRICNDSALRSSNAAIYLNLTTLEGLEFCLRLSPRGFRIIGNRHDCADNANDDGEDDVGEYYETIYSLLNSISPQYRDSFGGRLFDKLEQLSKSQN